MSNARRRLYATEHGKVAPAPVNLIQVGVSRRTVKLFESHNRRFSADSFLTNINANIGAASIGQERRVSSETLFEVTVFSSGWYAGEGLSCSRVPVDRGETPPAIFNTNRRCAHAEGIPDWQSERSQYRADGGIKMVSVSAGGRDVDIICSATENSDALQRRTLMADENAPENVTESLASEAQATPAPKKTRAPRQKRISSETAVSSSDKPAKATRAKRGSKGGRRAKAAIPEGTGSEAAVQEVATPAEFLDDIADLIKLEEENKRLRKLLSDKLRAENADLRKRLGQG